MSDLQTLIFDVDGTLAETEDAHRLAFNLIFKQYGLPWQWDKELYAKLLAVAGGKERILHYIEDYDPPSQAAFPADLQDYVATMHAEKTQLYQTMLKTGDVPLRKGVKRFITQAHDEGMRLAIATTTSRSNVVSLIESSFDPDALAWFELIASGEMVSQKKPSPEVYQCVLDGMSVTASDCVAFEDSYIGFCAAKAANITTIVTVDEYSRHRQFDGAAIVLNSFGEPDQPFDVIAGNGLGHTFVDLDFIKKIHAEHVSE